MRQSVSAFPLSVSTSSPTGWIVASFTRPRLKNAMPLAGRWG